MHFCALILIIFLGESDYTDSEEEPTEEEIEQMTKEIFDELKSKKTGKITVAT